MPCTQLQAASAIGWEFGRYMNTDFPLQGLAGPAKGVGGPAPGSMLPRPQVQHPTFIAMKPQSGGEMALCPWAWSK